MDDMLRELMKETPEAVQPAYITSVPNERLTLFEGDLTLDQRAESWRGPGKIELAWLPRPRVRFTLTVGEAVSLMALQMAPARLSVPVVGTPCSVQVTRINMNQTGGVTSGSCAGFVPGQLMVGPETGCTEILFHVPNMISYVGGSTRDPCTGKLRSGRLELRSDEWAVVLDENAVANELTPALRDQGGFALTHTGTLTTIDRKPIAATAADKVLDALYYFLSFMRGFRCGPILAVGRTGGATLWKRWALPRLTSWRGVLGWFPYLEPKNLTRVSGAFRGYMARWRDELWTDPLKVAIHWYVEANLNAGGIEGAIVLAQTALELLGWVYMVEDPATRVTSGTQYKQKMNADGRIRRLLALLGIPVQIPAPLADLANAAAALGAEDGPAAFVRLRNAIVHPSLTKRNLVLQTPVSARMQAWHLGLWYLEMVLLRLFAYQGVYYRRFVDGYPSDARSSVPWTESS